MTHTNKHHCRGRSQNRQSSLWIWPISILSPLSLPRLNKVVMAGMSSKGCPEGQSELLLNVHHVNKKSQTFVSMVTDYTGTARSHWSSKTLPGKQISRSQTFATSHEKKEESPGWSKRPESRARSMKTYSSHGIKSRNFICLVVATSNGHTHK